LFLDNIPTFSQVSLAIIAENLVLILSKYENKMFTAHPQNNVFHGP
jgi:hypothetical protein